MILDALPGLLFAADVRSLSDLVADNNESEYAAVAAATAAATATTNTNSENAAGSIDPGNGPRKEA